MNRRLAVDTAGHRVVNGANTRQCRARIKL